MKAIITGASSGIGEEFARKLSANGYELILVARRMDRLEALAKTLPTECRCYSVDLANANAIEEFLMTIEQEEIDVLINNAGFGDCGPFCDTSVEKELQMVDVNIKAMHQIAKAMLVKMRAQGRGQILNIASSAGLLPAGPYMATYYATKAYVTSFTRAIARELKDEKSPVYIGCICPGPVDTEFNKVANVEFALNGITVEQCVKKALMGMKRRKVTIVPSFSIWFLVFMSRFAPTWLVVRVCGHQQKKKIGR